MFLPVSLSVALAVAWTASGAMEPILTRPLCWMKIVSHVRLPWMMAGSDLWNSNPESYPSITKLQTKLYEVYTVLV